MVLESIASNCLVLLPTRIIGLPFYAPSCNAFNATQNYSIRKKKCLHKSAEHFYFAKYASTGKLMSDLRHTHSTILESLLKRYLSTDINETHGTVTYLIPICWRPWLNVFDWLRDFCRNTKHNYPNPNPLWIRSMNRSQQNSCPQERLSANQNNLIRYVISVIILGIHPINEKLKADAYGLSPIFIINPNKIKFYDSKNKKTNKITRRIYNGKKEDD